MLSSHQKIILTAFLCIIIFLAIPHTVYASWVKDLLGTELIPAGCTGGRQPRGSCGINEIMQVLYNITRIMFGVMGSAALLMFVYGGLLWIISMGRSSEVEKAKGILLNSIYGIIIILTAWIIVNFIVLALTGGKVGEIGKIFTQPWNKLFSPN